MSKFIHQKIIESVSEVGAKTIARPSGIIGGGLLALVGSLLVLVVARKVGFEVPYSLFAVLFIIGFVLGLIVEFTRNIFKKITINSLIIPRRWKWSIRLGGVMFYKTMINKRLINRLTSFAFWISYVLR